MIAGTLTVSFSTFTTNRVASADGKGGAIYMDKFGILAVSFSTFDSNFAGDYGGAIFMRNGEMTITHSWFKNNYDRGGPATSESCGPTSAAVAATNQNDAEAVCTDLHPPFGETGHDPTGAACDASADCIFNLGTDSGSLSGGGGAICMGGLAVSLAVEYSIFEGEPVTCTLRCR